MISILQVDTINGRPVADVRVEHARGYWRVDFLYGDKSTLNGAWCLAEVIDWVLSDIGRNYPAPVRLAKRITKGGAL